MASPVYNDQMHNFEKIRSDSDVLIGTSSLRHDGSPITLGHEPYLVTPEMDWHFYYFCIETFAKSTSLNRQCLFSIADGTGNRYFDLHIEGGNTAILLRGY